MPHVQACLGMCKPAWVRTGENGMKKRMALLAATAAAMMVASPAAADGYLGVGYQDSQGGSGFSDGEGWQVEGAWGFGGAGWGGQVDGSFGQIDFGSGDEGDLLGLTGHLFWSGGNWRLGGVVSVASADFGGGGGDLDETNYGVVGSYALAPNVILSGSATVGNMTWFFGADIDTFNADARLSVYPSDNIRLGATLGAGRLDPDGGPEADSTTYGLDAEFRPWSFPVSFAIDYTHYEEDIFGSERDVVYLAGRWNFGGGSLRDRDNSAPFETRTNLARHYGIR